MTTHWTVLTRRTEAPKLPWLMRALNQAGVECRLNGESFHAPVMEVHEGTFDRAWRVLSPVDNLPDDDPLFEAPGSARAWWLSTTPNVANLVAAVGLLANKVRREIATGVKCVPEGASPYDCPYATGVIPACPARLWSICRPMARLEVFCLALSEVLDVDEAKVLRRVEELLSEARRHEPKGEEELGTSLISMCHVFGNWMTQDGLLGLAGYANKGTRKLILGAMKETATIDGVRVPRQAEVDAGDVIEHGFNPELN